MLIETLSTPWVRVLTANKREGDMDPIMTWPGPPDAINRNTQSGFNARAVVNLGHGGGLTVQRIKIMPFCEGPPGSIFWTTIFGWSPVGTVEEDPTKAAWLFNLLAQFMCVAGDIHGPQPLDNVQTTNALLPGENLCDGLSLTAGVLGLNGFINSNFPGTGIPAVAAIEVFGAKKVSFDFSFPQEIQPIGMNCFMSRL